MRIATILLLVFWGMLHRSEAQTTIQFVPQKDARNGLSQLETRGRIEQTGQSFSRKLRIKLPQKMLDLTLRPSPLKQYTTLITSSGEVPSQVDLYEADDTNQKYYITTVNNQFNGLLFLEGGSFMSLEKANDSLYTYRKSSLRDRLTGLCTQEVLSSSPAINGLARRAVPAGSCYEFPIGFVSDYSYFRTFNGLAEFEADNLLKVAATQEIWAATVFDAAITFKIIGSVVSTTEDDKPWSANPLQPLSSIWGQLNNSWAKPARWKNYTSLIVAGLTAITYGRTEAERSTWGYGGTAQNEFGMGTLVMKGLLDRQQLRWLLAHELGHVFGSGHDEAGNYVMYPVYPAGSIWSPQSKQAINETLSKLESKQLLRKCPAVNLTYQMQGDSLIFSWQTTHESANDSFLVESSTDERKTWTPATKMVSKGSFSYQYKVPFKLTLGPATYFQVRQQGDNVITSNIVTVSLTGLAPESTGSGVSIYPNPTVNQLTIKTPTPDAFAVFDLTGRQVYRVSVPNSAHVVDTTSWPSGLYFIRFDTTASTMYKVVK